MTNEQFVLWLQGFAELSHQPPTLEQWQRICERLNNVLQDKGRAIPVVTCGNPLMPPEARELRRCPGEERHGWQEQSV